MSTNWIRYASITISGNSETIDCSKLKCTFEITQHIMQSPDQLRLTIVNLSEATASRITQNQIENETVTLDVGYQDNHGIIFRGQILQAIYGRENPTDTFLWILATGEWGYKYARVNTTLPAGSSQKDVFDTAMKAFEEHGAKQGTVTPNLESVIYSMPVVLYGMARDIIRNIALSNESTWWIGSHDASLHMLETNKLLSGNEITLNSTSGLIGMPQQTFDGIIVRALINPALKPGGTVIIDQNSIRKAQMNVVTGGSIQTNQNLFPGISADGRYKIIKMDITGDTRGNDWYCDMVCLSPQSPGGGQFATMIGTE